MTENIEKEIETLEQERKKFICDVTYQQIRTAKIEILKRWLADRKEIKLENTLLRRSTDIRIIEKDKLLADRQRLEDELKCFMDGDSLCVTKMNFRNLQEDEAVFIKIKKDKQDKVWQLTKDHPSIKCGCSKCKSATEFQASGGAP